VGTLLTTLFAAVSHTYPFRGRLLFFLIPFFYLAIAALFSSKEGLSRHGEIGPRTLRREGFIQALTLIVLSVTIVKNAIQLFYHPFDNPQSKRVLECMRSHLEGGDRFVVELNTYPSFNFYAPHYGIPRASPESRRISRKLKDALAGDELKFFERDPGRWWLVSFHSAAQFGEFTQRLRQKIEPIATCKGEGAHAYLFDLKHLPLESRVEESEKGDATLFLSS
jgi:hypothetical protein